MIFQRPAFIIPSLLLISTSAFATSANNATSVRQDPAPTKAPFSTDGTKADNGSKLFSIYDDTRQQDVVPMDKPHRTTEQVSTWVEEQATTAMNIDPSKWPAQQAKIKPLFDGYGFQEYSAYLQNSGLMAQLTDGKLKLNAIIDGPAVLLNEASVSGAYHWLYDLPLMLTYYNDSTVTLKKGDAKPRNQKVMVRLQIGRAAKGVDDNNIVIERWKVTPIQ